METGSDNSNEPKFSEDPQENLRIENELLKLKMQAERGAIFGDNMEGISPEMEAQFLENILRFEESFDKGKEVTVYECIGKPEYRKIDALNSEDIEKELTKITELLQSRNIMLELPGEYDPSLIYQFIVQELFFEKIREVNIPGYVHHFIYDEFHPNHRLSIEKTAQEFLNHWFEKGFDENSFEFDNFIITAEGKTYKRDEVILKLRDCLDCYRSFTNIKFKNSDTNFQWDATAKSGMGHAEGMFNYDAVIEAGDVINIEGPFKLYMSNLDGVWKIFYFVFPGFNWN